MVSRKVIPHQHWFRFAIHQKLRNVDAVTQFQRNIKRHLLLLVEEHVPQFHFALHHLLFVRERIVNRERPTVFIVDNRIILRYLLPLIGLGRKLQLRPTVGNHRNQLQLRIFVKILRWKLTRYFTRYRLPLEYHRIRIHLWKRILGHILHLLWIITPH